MTERYAARTEVGADRSRAELERILVRYGADEFAYGWSGDQVVIAFRIRGRRCRFNLPVPRKDDKVFLYTPARGERRSDSAAFAAWEQAVKQRWRALVLIVKAKLEAVEAGITTVETEFLPWALLPTGQTVAEWAEEAMPEALRSGRVPSLLPGGAEPGRSVRLLTEGER
jgi:hypothetical protein